MKRIIAVIFATIIVMLTTSLTSIGDGYYDISAYDVDILVGEDNTYEITETITVNFKQAQHGIYRDIDVKYYGYRHEISDIVVTGPGESYAYNTEISRNGQYQRIKIGHKDHTYSGEMVYQISYIYHMGEDYMEGDELYFDIIGMEWDCWIENITFKIQMPKAFDESNLNFTYGSYGSEASEFVIYEVNNDRIEGYFDGYLMPNQGITVALPLPEDYFTGEVGRSAPYFQTLMVGILALVAIITVFYKRKYKENNRFEIVERRTPPESLNVPEVAYVVNNEVVSNTNMVSQVLKWAADGLITIKEHEEKVGLVKKNIMTFTKIYDMEDRPSYEKQLYKAFFRHGDGTTVTSEELSMKLYKDLTTACSSLKRKFLGDKEILVNKVQKNVGWFILGFSLLFILYGGFAIDQYVGLGYGVSLAISFGVYIELIVNVFLIRVLFGKYRSKQSKIIAFVVFLFIGGSVIGIFLAGMMMDVYDFSRGLASHSMLMLVSFVLAMIAIFNVTGIKEYTPYGKQMMEHILGFKLFMQSGKMDDIEAVYKGGANYYYDILPYAMVCGLTHIWKKRVAELSIQPPDWYSSYRHFNAAHFATDMSRGLMTTSASPSSSSSSGGSAGGGGGGGGGGSW